MKMKLRLLTLLLLSSLSSLHAADVKPPKGFRALFNGKAHVGISDIRAIAANALRHRLGLTFDAEAEGLSAENIIEMVLNETPEVSNKINQEIRA